MSDDTVKAHSEVTESASEQMEKSACLVIIHGLNIGRKININKDEIVIGRSEDSDIIIDLDYVSRRHAVVTKDNGVFIIEDNKSRHGTYVNTQKVEKATLHDHDLILIGNTIIKFILADNIEHAYHEEIFKLATKDQLLNIYNRSYFFDKLQDELNRSYRYKRSLSLIMFEIDHFRQISDNYRHHVGDYILKRIARIIKNNLRREDTFARYSAENFVIILPETNFLQAAITSEKLRKLVEIAHFDFRGDKFSITISIGLVSYKSGRYVDSHLELIENAKHALYQAKKTGRNKVMCYEKINIF